MSRTMAADGSPAKDRSIRAGWLLAVAALLVVAVMMLPWHVAAVLTGTSWTGPEELAESVRQGLMLDWNGGVANPGQGASALADATQFWRWFHVLKAILAVGVMLVSAMLILRTWRSRRSGVSPARRFGLLLASGAGGVLFLLSLVVVIANVQGAVAPLSSVLSFLSAKGSGAGFTGAVSSLLDNVTSADPSAPALSIIRDFSMYHVVVALLLAATTVLAAVLSIRLLRSREWLASGALLVVSLAFALLTVANVGTALHPIPAFADFLSGVVA